MYRSKNWIAGVLNFAYGFKQINSKNLKIPFNFYSSTTTKTLIPSNLVKQGDGNVMLRMKKRPVRMKTKQDTVESEGFFNVNAFATAEEYNLESLLEELEKQNLYATKKFSTDNLGVEQDVLYIRAKYEIEKEPRDIFFFREGCVVLWNCSVLETNNILNIIKNHEQDRYLNQLIQSECEVMPYSYAQNNEKSMIKNGTFLLTNDNRNFLQKYTFSNAMSATVKLGICEAILDIFVDDMEFITEDLKKGRNIRISRAEVLRKTGELFALRHLINLSSDLLDTPDFYWDREELETIYTQVCGYFNISRRTKVMNEKLNHLIELAHLVSSNLNDAHHVRLEWMIIILITVEVAFEILHYVERFF